MYNAFTSIILCAVYRELFFCVCPLLFWYKPRGTCTCWLVLVLVGLYLLACTCAGFDRSVWECGVCFIALSRVKTRCVCVRACVRACVCVWTTPVRVGCICWRFALIGERHDGYLNEFRVRISNLCCSTYVAVADNNGVGYCSLEETS